MVYILHIRHESSTRKPFRLRMAYRTDILIAL